VFEQALLESARHNPGTRRAYSTGVSLLIQGTALAAFIIIPLLTTQVVPTLQQRSFVFLPEHTTPVPQIEPAGNSSDTAVMVAARPLVPPRHIGPLNPNPPEAAAAPSIHPSGSTGSSSVGPMLATSNASALPEDLAAKRPPVSVLEQGVVLSRVQPVYPRLAVEARVQGSVRLHALITSGGTLEELQLLSGHPMLAKAAMDAVRQWRFRPYVLNGNPIEVQTEIIVNFSLN